MSEDGLLLRCGWCEGDQPINCNGFGRVTLLGSCSVETPCGLVVLQGDERGARCLEREFCTPGEQACTPDLRAATECYELPDGSTALAYYACLEDRTCGVGPGRCDLR